MWPDLIDAGKESLCLRSGECTVRMQNGVRRAVEGVGLSGDGCARSEILNCSVMGIQFPRNSESWKWTQVLASQLPPRGWSAALHLGPGDSAQMWTEGR